MCSPRGTGSRHTGSARTVQPGGRRASRDLQADCGHTRRAHSHQARDRFAHRDRGGAETLARSTRIWGVATARPVGAPLTGHTKGVYAVATAVVAGRPVVVSSGHDTTVRVWDPATGRQIGRMPAGHAYPVWAVATSVVDGRPMSRLPETATSRPESDAVATAITGSVCPVRVDVLTSAVCRLPVGGFAWRGGMRNGHGIHPIRAVLVARTHHSPAPRLAYRRRISTMKQPNSTARTCTRATAGSVKTSRSAWSTSIARSSGISTSRPPRMCPWAL